MIKYAVEMEFAGVIAVFADLLKMDNLTLVNIVSYVQLVRANVKN